MPPQHAGSLRASIIANPCTGARPETVYVGCAGWNIPRESAGAFASEGTHLQRYARTFNCCEINSSFYRPHKYSTWERWAASVPENFRFSVKVPRTITHDDALKCAPETLAVFLKQIGFLGHKLGPILVQLPPQSHFDEPIATRFFMLLRAQHKGDVVLEARHETWFSTRADELLKQFKITGAAADPACVPLASEPSGYEGFVYFRLHGSPRHYYSAYSGEFLEALAGRLVKFAQQARVWCIFDNTAHGFATPNALELSAQIGLPEH